MPPLNWLVQAANRLRWLLIRAFSGYRRSARTPTSGPCRSHVLTRSFRMGMRKHSVFPLAVPVRTRTEREGGLQRMSHARR